MSYIWKYASNPFDAYSSPPDRRTNLMSEQQRKHVIAMMPDSEIVDNVRYRANRISRLVDKSTGININDANTSNLATFIEDASRVEFNVEWLNDYMSELKTRAKTRLAAHSPFDKG